MKRVLALTMALGIALVACSGEEGAVTAPMVTTAADSGEGEAPGAEGMEIAFEVVQGRRVIRRAALELHSADTRSAYEQIVRMVETVGGFVADATVFPTSGEDEQPQVSLVLRVPEGHLNSAMTAIKAAADEVVSESRGAEDVTEQFIDLEARLTNHRALEVELRALLEEVREQENADPEKLLRVFNEVSRVRGEIEQMQGQLNHLTDLTELATLSVGITPTPLAVPIVDEPWAPAEVARDSLRNLVAGLRGIADWIIAFSLFQLPILLLSLGPLALLGYLIYRRFRRREPTGPAPAAGS
jgi:hypothetical protein